MNLLAVASAAPKQCRTRWVLLKVVNTTDLLGYYAVSHSYVREDNESGASDQGVVSVNIYLLALAPATPDKRCQSC